MLKIKRIVAFALAALTAGITSIGACAYNNNPFTLSISANSSNFTNAATKEDNLNYAVVRVLGGNAAPGRFMVLYVYKANTFTSANCVSKPVVIDETTAANYQLEYRVTRANGSSNYLCGCSGALSVSLNGRWDP